MMDTTQTVKVCHYGDVQGRGYGQSPNKKHGQWLCINVALIKLLISRVQIKASKSLCKQKLPNILVGQRIVIKGLFFLPKCSVPIEGLTRESKN